MSALREIGAVPAVMARQHLPPERLERLRRRAVARCIAHAVSTVPYYRERHDPARVTGLEDVGVLRKDEILAHGTEAFRSEAYTGDVVWTNTSGTTGRRLHVAHDAASYAYHNAACVRRMLATGAYRPWYRLLHFRPVGMPTRWYQRMGVFRRELALSSLDARSLIDAALASRPQAIIGYPTTLRDLARRMTTAERDRIRSHLRVVLTESELLLPAHRDLIATHYGAPVFDEYSAYEVLNITFECAAHHAHVAEDRIALEIVDDAGDVVPDGQEGTVVVTAFQERAMPLLRYDLRDRARVVPGRCPCGRTFRRIELVDGRRDEHVTLPDGSVLTVGTFLYLAAEHPGVAESMVRQAADGTLTVLLVCTPGASFPQVAEGYVRALRGLTGRRVPVRVEQVDAVPLTEGGKGRFLESALAAPSHGPMASTTGTR